MRTRRVTARRLGAALALCVVLGVLTTYVVAWGCVLLSGVREGGNWDQGYGFGPRLLESVDVPPPLRAWVPGEWSRRDSANLHGSMVAQGNWNRGTGLRLDAIEIEENWGPVPMPAHRTSVEVLRAGWPRHALAWAGRARHRSVADLAERKPLEWSGAVRTPRVLMRPAVRMMGERHRLPCIPVWPGFAVDVGIVAGPLAVITLVPVAVRLIRRRRGRCAGCGYDLTGAGGVCPECGA